jgi:hypothetical protein
VPTGTVWWVYPANGWIGHSVYFYRLASGGITYSGALRGTDWWRPTGDRPRTMIVWCCPTDNVRMPLCGFSSPGATLSEWLLYYDTNTIRVEYDTTHYVSVPWTYQSQWHTFACSYPGGASWYKTQVFVDGMVLPGTTSGADGPLDTGSLPFTVGHAPNRGTAKFYGGLIGMACVWNACLGAGDIAALSHDPLSLFETRLLYGRWTWPRGSDRRRREE